MKFNSFLKAFLLGCIVVFAISCDKDFNEIGTDFVDNDHYNLTRQKYDVLAYNQPTGHVQTNNLPLNSLGFYNNPAFGTTKADFVTQLELGTTSPTFILPTNSIQIDSVYLHVPYFSSLTATDANGDSTYELQSVYGDLTKKIKLEVFRSNYYLRNLDPNPISGLLEQQSYFSDDYQIGTISESQYPNRLNTGVASQNDDFQFSPSQIKFLKTDPVTNLPVVPNVVRERLLPGIYMDLDKVAFKNDIIQAAASNLADNNTFKNYYRGLYFKVSAHGSSPDGAALALLNFAQGKIVIVYKDSKSTADATLVRKTMTLNMKGFTANLLTQGNNTTNSGYTTAMASPNQTTGDPRLYVKGGVGAMSVIELFKGRRNSDPGTPSDPNPLHTMREENWLINEANLIFNIDNSSTAMGANDIKMEPSRIYLYDLNNKKPLVDYYLDSSTSLDTRFNKYVHGGIISKATATDRGVRYKIRITNHIRSLVKNIDSTNVKLGLVLTENINVVTNNKLRAPFDYYITNLVTGLPELKSAKQIPSMSAMSPLGTILYGNNIPSGDGNYDKRLQLEIVYTKPD